MKQPLFNEKDIQNLFGPPSVPTQTPPSTMIEVEFQPEFPINRAPAPTPVSTPIPTPAAVPAPIAPPTPPIPPAPKKIEPEVGFWPTKPTPSTLPTPSFQPPLQSSFATQNESPPNLFFQTVVKFFGIFILIFVISFTIINGQAIILKLKYFWDNNYRNSSWTTTGSSIPTPIPTESRLIIPKIRVNAPIIWNISADQIIPNLEHGVVQYQGTAMPGQAGNIFITGHSSYYLWAPGDYKDVFALLNELDAGDKIYLQYQGVTFSYEVTNQKVVRPDDMTVLSSSSEKLLSLMTCVPVGTNLERLIVTAKQIPN